VKYAGLFLLIGGAAALASILPLMRRAARRRARAEAVSDRWLTSQWLGGK
jgi:hypothetical protein